MSAQLIGVDVGGTFTDLLLVDGSGRTAVAKVPTTPENQAFGVMAAIAECGADLGRVGTIVHGTTVTTNAVLERRLARTGLITTLGFRDVLELGRRTRPTPYGLTGTFEPLISRELRAEVDERIDADGNVLRALDGDGVRAAIERLLELGAESLVIHFLHAYRNPVHEREALAIARDHWPNRYVTAGHVILSEYREYERGTAAAVNASVMPILHRYVDRLASELTGRGYDSELLIMRGNGGTVSAGLVAETAVNTVMSGPASGVMAAAHAARAAHVENVITYDMGGTSCDVGLITGGVPAVSSELEIEYAVPIHVPMVDVHTIGAGGGSIAFIDEAGMLQVGPRSAGAVPGPICYGRGGERVTITDANVVLGRLDPQGLLSVAHPVSVDALREAMVTQIGAALGLDAEAAAAAVVRIADDRMAGALRMVSLARGHDPRDFALFAFGGAGPLHAAALAAELGIPRVLVPPRPGITNALGCVVADVRQDYVRTVNAPLASVDMEEVHAIYREQVADGREMIERQGVEVESITVLHTADLQFQGQSHLLTVPVASGEVDRETLQATFERAYYDRFAVELPEIRAVLVNLATAVIGRRRLSHLDTRIAGDASTSAAHALAGKRPVWFAGGWVGTPVYRREGLPPGTRLDGPAIVNQLDATTVVPPGATASVDAGSNIVIEVKPVA